MNEAKAREALIGELPAYIASGVNRRQIMKLADTYAKAAALTALDALAAELGEDAYLEPHIWDAFQRVREATNAE